MSVAGNPLRPADATAFLSAPAAVDNARPRFGLSRTTVGRWAAALGAFFGAIVIREPSPYEVYMLAAMAGFLLFGLRLDRTALSLGALLVTFVVGGVISMMTMADYKTAPLYLFITLFLALSSVFWCAVIAADAGRLRSIMRGYVAGALLAATLGILGYFHAFPGAEIFTRYDRAMGTFQDPNVFGPFLVLPTLYLVHGVLYRSPTLALFRLAALAVLLVGILLSFSRAAWGLTLFSSITFYALMVMTEPNQRTKLKLILMGVLGVLSLAIALLIALQFDAIANMFEIRAKVVQDYDGSELGRFARHWIGFGWAMENPLGIGPLEFGTTLGEDTHNIWLKALMGYGWLGFAAYVAMVVITLTAGGRLLGRLRPWQPFLMMAYVTFLGHLLLAWVIDIDHWRHAFLLIGMIWGCIALEAQHQRQRQTI